MRHLDSDGGEDAEVALLHSHEDEPQIVEVIPCELESPSKILDIVRLYPSAMIIINIEKYFLVRTL